MINCCVANFWSKLTITSWDIFIEDARTNDVVGSVNDNSHNAANNFVSVLGSTWEGQTRLLILLRLSVKLPGCELLSSWSSKKINK